MACRHADIEKYEHDIKVLEEASSLAQKVIDYQNLINSSVDTLKADYKESINPPTDLDSSFDFITDDALSDARIIKTQIDGAITTAKYCLADAIEEDDEYHAKENNQP